MRQKKSLQTRSEIRGVADIVRSVYGEVEGVRGLVEGFVKVQADQISAQNIWMARTEERFRNFGSRHEGQGSSQIFESLAEMEEGTAGLGDAFDN